MSLDIFPLRKNAGNANSGPGPTGPTGANGKNGLNGPTGPNGEMFGINFEFLTSSEMAVVISTTINTTIITNDNYNQALFTLAEGNENDIKFIYLQNNTLPIHIQTNRGSFLMDANNARIQLVFQDGIWVQLSDKIPWFVETLQDTLVGNNVSGATANQGFAVAFSADGNTCAIGGPDDGISVTGFRVGAVWIFTRSEDTWTQEAKLVAVGGSDHQEQGSSIALSADGNTLVVGAPQTDIGTVSPPVICCGVTWIFVRSNGSWSQQAMLVGL